MTHSSTARSSRCLPWKTIELVAVSYGICMGLYLWWTEVTGLGAIWWTFRSGWVFNNAGAIFMCSALIHALGVRINGRWRWSPLLRLVGLGGHLLVVGHLAVWGLLLPAASSSTPNYCWMFLALLTVWIHVLKDLLRNITSWGEFRGDKPV